MALERTLSIIKPDLVAKNQIGEVIRFLERGGLKVIAARMVFLSKVQAEGFYAAHRERPFFDSLTNFMSSGPAVPMVLEGENAIARNREIMGATDPANADDGTIRKALGSNVERNAVHGSDSPETARTEINFFFSDLDICG